MNAQFEQLKKQKEKGRKVTEEVFEKKKDEEKLMPDASTVSTLVQDVALTVESLNTKESSAPIDITRPSEHTNTVMDAETPTKPLHNRQPSLSLQSKMRSSSFRRTSISQTPLSPSVNGGKSLNLAALSPDGDAVTEIHRKQALRLDELEKENKRLFKDVEVAEGRWRKTEDELEELRENSGQVAELKARAEKANARVEEVNKLVRHAVTVPLATTYLCLF